MKTKILHFLIIGSLALFSSCENLDREIITTVSEKQVMKSFDYSKNRVSAIYTDLSAGFLYIDGAMMASVSDEAEHTLETSIIQKFNTGAWNTFDNPDDVWAKYYKGIRRVNQFLVSADSIDLNTYRLDPDAAQQAVYKSKMAEIKRWKYEVRLLRAFFYFELVKRYGGVPILKQALSLDSDFNSIPRNTLSECIQYVSNECDSAASVLPLTYLDVDLGRVTKGAALALKSRVLLYASSDLFNSSSWAAGYSKPELVSLSGDRQARWKAAADAAKAVIDLNIYTLATNYGNLFKTFNSPEIILVRRDAASNAFEQASFPIGYDLGKSGTTPSLNLVDLYEMKDGSKFSWDNPVHAASPFDNRDPRLTMSVLTNNTIFKGRKVECWQGGLDGKGVERATKTSFYLKKYVDENIDLLQGKTSVHSWILFRLAEIYLNYAEALNEYNPGNPDIKIYVDKVRARSGVAMPPLPSGLSQNEMREKIRNERAVELAFEDQRFWDLKRWMSAPAYLGIPLKGLEITKTGDNTFSYKAINVENRTFENKMYFYPIPEREILKSNGWTQNPLW